MRARVQPSVKRIAKVVDPLHSERFGTKATGLAVFLRSPMPHGKIKWGYEKRQTGISRADLHS